MTKDRRDFARIMDPNRREHYVYRCYDAEGHILYIGCTQNLGERLRYHKSSARWFHLHASHTAEGPYNYETARRIEREATRDEDPPHNGFAPSVQRARRERHRLYDLVYETAVEHGESWDVAARQALTAVDSEVPA